MDGIKYLLPVLILKLQELEDPFILIHEKKISSINAVVKVLELAVKVLKPRCALLLGVGVRGFVPALGFRKQIYHLTPHCVSYEQLKVVLLNFLICSIDG